MPNHHYERLDEDYKVIRCPTYDYDGKYTGKIIINLPAYFDENPEERIRLGWMKHITYTGEEIREMYSWDPQSQYLTKSVRQVDEHTVEDVYHVLDKSEEMMLMEELGIVTDAMTVGAITFFGGEEM